MVALCVWSDQVALHRELPKPPEVQFHRGRNDTRSADTAVACSNLPRRDQPDQLDTASSRAKPKPVIEVRLNPIVSSRLKAYVHSRSPGPVLRIEPQRDVLE